ncbi:GtrA family protein [Yinghuangia soli]|uniref:GtrA family protein n=1 Tax=Yinghuangia soli TaxID=2908204 RepID=A0AA41QB20_9ACTN|nr:GtrA family protein [Yinghuangia soli]MCF2533487.1 GtrA family protein [Yinghuangia soli]
MLRQPIQRLRAHPMFPELAKFAVVGGTAYTSDVILFNILLTQADLGPLSAKAISLCLSIVVAFIGNRYWTYGERNGGEAASEVSRQGLFFVAITLVGMSIQLAFLGFSHYVLDFTSRLADNISGNLVGMGVATIFRFWGYRTWVFRHQPAAAEDAELPAQASSEPVAPGASGTDEDPAPDEVLEHSRRH